METRSIDEEKIDLNVDEVDTLTNDEDEIEQKDEKEIEVSTIDRVVPLTIFAKKNYQGHVIESLVLLAHDTNDGLVAFIHNYITYDKETVANIADMPFHSDDNFISQKMIASMIMNNKNVKCYITDFCFDLDEENNSVSLLCNPNDHTREQAKYIFSYNLYSSISFIDNYISNPDIINNHDLTLAVAHGYHDNNIDIFKVDNIKEIMNMAEVDKKSTTVALTLKLVNKADEELKLLCSFNIGIKFPSRKFKRATVEFLEKGFLQDGDQYLEEYMFTNRIKNEDKEYTVIRAKNKNNKTVLFLFTTDIVKKLETMIEEY